MPELVRQHLTYNDVMRREQCFVRDHDWIEHREDSMPTSPLRALPFHCHIKLPPDTPFLFLEETPTESPQRYGVHKARGTLLPRVMRPVRDVEHPTKIRTRRVPWE
jgi:hypothetical protein